MAKGFKSTRENVNVNRMVESNLKYSQSIIKMCFDFLRVYIHEEYEFKKALSPEERAEMRSLAERMQLAAQKSDLAIMKEFGKGVKFFNSSLKDKVVLILKELRHPEELKSKIDIIVSNVKLFYQLDSEIKIAELEEKVSIRAKEDELKLKLIAADNTFELEKRKIELEHERALKNLEEESFDPDSRVKPTK